MIKLDERKISTGLTTLPVLAKCPFFSGESLGVRMYARADKIQMLTTRRSRIYKASHVPSRRGRGPSAANLRTPTYAHMVRHNTTRFCNEAKLDEG